MAAGSVSGRIAVVTGASRGIGRAIALALAAAGARVAAVSRSVEALNALASDAAGRVLPFPADVTCEREVDAAFERAAQTLGTITIHVAAAGVARFGPTLDMPTSHWQEQISTNLTGMYLTNRAAIRQMLQGGGGDIVNLLSVASDVALPGSAAYTASKYGALGLTRSLSAEFRGRGIRFTALLPGATDTGLWDEAGSDLDRARMMTAADVAEAALWAIGRPALASVDEIRIMPRDGLL